MPNSSPPLLQTKILATVGPACAEPATLVRMIEEGARLFRVNFSHGDLPDFQKSVEAVREAARRTDFPIGILGDLSGPKIRVTQIEGGKMLLNAGDHVEFPKTDAAARRDPDTGVVTIGTTYPEMVDDAEAGQRLLINDGAIRLLITDKITPENDRNRGDRAGGGAGGEGGGGRLICRVTEGGELTPKKGVNLPDTRVSAPALTDWDQECAAWAVEAGLDFLALSFVRRAEDVRELKALLKSLGRDNTGQHSKSRLPIVSKLEKPQAIEDLDGILEETDAVMVARGDLGVEMDLAQVPIIQKRIIERAHQFGKPAIVATQMLESMIQSFTPTRAEVSDVANAILDAADTIMLSGETAVGQHPVQAVSMMARTARQAEAYAIERQEQGLSATRKAQLTDYSRYQTAALARGVSTVVKDLKPKFVVMWSELGGGARHLAQNRLPVPVLAASSRESTLRQMSMLFGVHPLVMTRPADSIAFLESIDALLQERGWAEPGDAVVVVKGEPLGIPGVTNEIRIHYVGDVSRITWHAKDQ